MKKWPNEGLCKLVYLIRSTFPSSIFFYIIFFCFKFIGLFLSTHNPKGYEDNLITVSSLLLKLTLFGFSLEIVSKDYFITSLAFFAVFIYILVHLTIIYLQLNHLYENQLLNPFGFLLNKKFTSRRYKIYIKLLGYIILLLLFVSNYIQEYLSFVVFAIILQLQINSNDPILAKDQQLVFLKFKEEAVFSPIALCVINILSIIILNCLLFSFLLLNSTKALWLHSGFNGYSNKIVVFCLMLFFWFQSLNNVCYLFSEEYVNFYRIIFNICAVVMLSFFLLSHLSHFNHYRSFVPQFNLFICVWCWYSGLIEIVIYYLCDKLLTQAYSLLKLIVELTNAFLFTYVILTINSRHFLSLFSEHLFNNNQKHTSIGESFAYIHLLIKVLGNSQPHHLELISMILIHKSKCVTPKCPCIKLLNDKEKRTNDISFKEMLIIIGEQDIVTRIHHLYKKSKSQSYPLEDYCVLHCEFVYEIKQHIPFALYLSSKYLHSKLKLGLLSKCYLYEIKKQIIHEVFAKTKRKTAIYNTSDTSKNQINYLTLVNNQTERNAINANLKAFYDHINFINMVKSLMIVCCNGLESILSIRSAFQSQNSRLRSTMDKRQYEHFIISCKKIKENNEKLVKLITKQMKEEVISHSELSYLLTNYFDLLYKKLPNDIKGTFTSLPTASDIPKNEHFRDFLKYGIKNPLILKFTHTDSFIIDYFSTDLAEKLGYNKGSLIGKDIHDYIPVEIVANHKQVMKQFLFIQNASLVRDTFILSSEHNLINIQLDCKVLPNLTNPFFIIIDAEIINHKSPSSFVYFLMMDSELKILAVNKRFEEQFFFNVKMIELLKVNFCGFFGLNQVKFLKKTQELFKKSKQMNLEEEAKSISIMTTVKQEKIFSYRRIKHLITSCQSHFEDIIEKQQVIDGLSALIKIVNDLGLDIEWYNRVRHLNERIKMSLDQTIPSKVTTYYKSIYHLRQIGAQRYYVVKLMEYADVKSIIANTVYLHASLLKQKIPDMKLCPEIMRLNRPMKAMMKLSSQSITNLDRVKGTRYLKSSVLYSSNINDSLPITSKAFESELMGQCSSSSKFQLLQKKSLNLNRSPKQEISASTENNINSPNTFTSWTKKKSIFNNSNTTALNRDRDFIINESKRLQMYVAYNRLSKRYTLFFYFALVVLLLLLVSFIIVKYMLMNIHKSLFNISIYSSMVKTDILFGALLNMAICVQIDNESDATETNSDRFIPISNDLIQHYSILTSHLNNFVSKENMNSIFEIINQMDSYEYLQSNWSAKIISSSLTELIYIFRLFFSESVIVLKPVCRLRELFYGEKYKRAEDASLIEEPALEEQLLFFNIYNLMNKIKPKFDLILERSTSLLFGYHDSFSQIVMVISIIIWIPTMLLLFVLFNKVIIDQKLTKTICSYIYTQSSQEESDKQKLIAFRDIIIDFSKKKISAFELTKIKGNYSRRFSNILIAKGSHNNINTNSINNSSNQTNDAIASTSPLNQITKQSIYNKSIRLQRQSSSKDQKSYLSNEMNTELLLIIFVAIIVTSIELASVLLSLHWESRIIFSISIAIDFLERIPIFIEFLFYSEISAVMNDIHYIQNDVSVPSTREKYLNYYKKSIDITENTQVNYFSDSLYSTLYYEALLVEENIRQFTSYDSGSLSSLRQWEEKFNEKNGICVYGVLGAEFDTNHPSFSSNYEHFSNLSHSVRLCRLESQSAALNDFDSSIEYLIQGLTNVYYDFATEKRENEKRIDWFLSNQTVYQRNFANPMKLAFKTYSYFLLKELTVLHDNAISNELRVSFALLVVVLIIFVYAIIGIIQKSEHCKRLLIFFVSLSFSTLEIDLSLYDE